MASRIHARSTTAGTPVKSYQKRTSQQSTNSISGSNPTKIQPLINQSNYLQQHASRLERDLDLLRRRVLPINDLLHIPLRHLELITVPDRRLQQDPNRIRKLLYTSNTPAKSAYQQILPPNSHTIKIKQQKKRKRKKRNPNSTTTTLHHKPIKTPKPKLQI